MTDQPASRVRFARRFVATTPGEPDIHGVEFPDSGHVIADVPYLGLTGFLTVDNVIEGVEGAAIHWAADLIDPKAQRASTEGDNP